MSTRTILDFPVGSYVESVPCPDAFSDISFVGTVVGMSVNLMGVPIPMVHMIASRFTQNPNRLGWTPVAADYSNTYWERVGPMHPSSIQPLQATTYLRPPGTEVIPTTPPFRAE